MVRLAVLREVEIEEERNMSENNGLFVELKRDELQKMLNVRAEAHVHRAGVHVERLKRIGSLLVKTSEAGLEEEHMLITTAVDENKAGEAIEALNLSNSSMRDLQQHVTYAKDRERCHRQAAVLLNFAAAHLTREVYAFDIVDSFLSYLVDVEHPTAMPSTRFYERGVQ